MAHGYGYRSEQRLRKENQDTFGVFEFPAFTLVVVCDGMGGHVGGRQASSLAVRTIHDELKAYTGTDVRAALRRAIEAANRTIYETARKNYRLMGMGTTAVAAIVQGQTAHIAHVGDSRAYLLRDGQLRALTRDHTMVNLFVDAELLSPEDAATHPEAHVLSRSLGVERQVEVDLSEPLPIQLGDRLLLCSDGVHGVLGVPGLASIDWRNPQEGADAAADAVARSEGDDNATIVAYGLAISGSSAAATEPPDPSAMEEEARAAPVQMPAQPARRSTLVPAATQAEQDVLPVESLAEETLSEVPAPEESLRGTWPTTGARTRSGVGTGASAPPAAPATRSRRPILAAAALVALVSVAAGGIAVVRLGRAWLGPEAPEAPAAVIEIPAADAPAPGVGVGEPAGVGAGGDGVGIEVFSSGSRGLARGRCLDCSSSLAVPFAGAYLSSADDPQTALALFAPEVPSAPRRPPNTTSVYDRPPPSGPEQTKAVRAARNKRCREALDTVRGAIATSIDYASLYGATWYCFNDTHTATLSKARAATWNEFVPLLEHFEGSRVIPAGLTAGTSAPPRPRPAARNGGDAPAAPTASTPADADADAASPGTADAATAGIVLADQPDTWKIPAAGGIEYRLALYELDDDVQGFRAIMVDLLTEPTVADHLAADVLLIATAAAAVARMEEPTSESLQVWSRRVYVASRAMTGPVGELIRAHRPEVAGMIEALLFEATGGDEGLLAIEEGFANEAVPPVVARAQAAGLAGQMENVLEERGATAALLPPVETETAAADVDDGRSERAAQPRRGSSRSSYAGRRRSELQRSPASSASDPGVFDQDAFGYLKVWYPRRRIPRLLSPYTERGVGLAEEGAETSGGPGETVDADWSTPKP